ncbi:MAG: C_GCAxxG_C_C family protein [Planctomycetes bacterium]|nr:C_GCAxxG_C_C family protein [Planctomycetota bacterium]
MSRIDIAVTRFEEGCSFAQAIFSTFAESLGVDRQTAMKLSSGFGGGMGLPCRHFTVACCGAVS